VCTLSDHFPIWGTISGKFAASRKTEQVGQKLDFTAVTEESKRAFNQELRETKTDLAADHVFDPGLFCTKVVDAAWHHVKPKDKQIKKPWITNDTMKKIEHKHKISRTSNPAEFKKASREAKKAVNLDWEKWLGSTMDKDLDLRDKWLGIRFLKKKNESKTYEGSDRFGKQVNASEQAAAAAEYLQKEQWGDKEDHLFDRSKHRSTKCNRRDNKIDTAPFSVEEVRSTVKKMKRNKASGPDLVPMEMFKLLDDENLQWVADILNKLWLNGECPSNVLKAFVASIYKKGDPKQQSNYRPISLLNSIYKIYAALLKGRLSSAIDKDLQRTQFGFRAARSTSIPVNCIKRVIERACASQDPAILVFLDWEKAFDRIRQDKLIECLKRMNVDQQMINAISSLYASPSFAVKIGSSQSDWSVQERGIRQGCPLSPYLFLIVMTVMFRDIHGELNLERGKLWPLSYTELLYADDTVLITNNQNAMNRFLQKVESHAAYFGLRFNKKKCVALAVNSDAKPRFANGDKVAV